METKRKRVTLDLDPTFQRRLKAIAALKGVSMRRYCQDAIGRELTKDEAIGIGGLLSDKPDDEPFAELRGDLEAAEATLLKYRKLGREAFDPSIEEQPPKRYISADEYPLLAELWDNDADAVYDEM